MAAIVDSSILRSLLRQSCKQALLLAVLRSQKNTTEALIDTYFARQRQGNRPWLPHLTISYLTLKQFEAISALIRPDVCEISQAPLERPTLLKGLQRC
jgi:hypothetical protein